MIRNEEQEAHRAWVATLKAGDQIMIERSIGYSRHIATPYTISRMSPKQGIVQDGRVEIRFRREDGKIIGEMFTRILQPTPERLAAYQNHQTRLKFHNAIERLRDWQNDVDISVIRELVDRLHDVAEEAGQRREKRLIEERELKARRGY